MDYRIRWLLLTLQLILGSAVAYKVGLGRADVTGPSVEITFMGYAKTKQKGTGIHLRQFARTFIIEEDGRRLVVVVTECQSIGHGVRAQVLKQLEVKFGGLYNDDNVFISGTHTHNGPGGFLLDFLFDISILGFVRQTFEVIVSGIVQSITRAHDDLAEGRISIYHGELLDVNVNRSPTAYLQNPKEERARYKYDVDKTMVQLRFERPDGAVVGAFSWFAVHGVSMNNTNTLVSSDNLGAAALLLEQTMNPGSMPGKGKFVGAIVQSNAGDSSPNTAGPRCISTGKPCDIATSTCPGKDECIAFGPGKDIFESTRIIGERLANKSLELLKANNKDRRYLKRGLKIVHQYQNMPNYKATYWNATTKKNVTVQGCLPAMGYSFAAGTTDGPGMFTFKQNTLSGNALWDGVRNLIHPPSKKQEECHHPKPILLSTGEITIPYQWQPSVVSTGLATLDDVVLVFVPGEFTTMAGRRLRDTVKDSLHLKSSEDVLVIGYCNTYTDYVTTFEEYQIQRYEGASTIYGPHTLSLYMDIYKRLALAANSSDPKVNKNPPPPDLIKHVISLNLPVLCDSPGPFKKFGDVLQQPPATVRPGDTVVVRFRGANPRNNLQTEGSYLTVDRQDGNSWTTVATDASWETKFMWERTSTLLGTSKVEIHWTVPPHTSKGSYRIQYNGHSKKLGGNIASFQGTTNTFTVE